MRRIVLLFAYVGAVVFAGAVALSLFGLDFVCYDECPPEADLSAALWGRLTGWMGTWLPGLVTWAIAWVLCITLLARAHRWGWLLILLLAPPAGVGLAVLVAFGVGNGHLFPTTWTAYGSWGVSKWLTLPPLLLGPLATILVGHALRAPGR